VIPKTNTVIPFDDLQWNESEKRFAALSDEELDKILEICIQSNVDGEDSAIKVVRWAEEVRTAHLLLKGVLNGRLGVIMIEGMKEPQFYENNNKENSEEDVIFDENLDEDF